MRYALLVTLVVLATLGVADVAVAQGAPSATPQVPGNTVPAWVFYWVLGLGSVVITGLFVVIKIMWEKADKTSGLSEEERNKLYQLFEWHNKVDGDQIPLWYTPRSMVKLIESLKSDHAAVQHLLKRIVEQNDGVNADLRQQLRERLETHDQMHTKMLRLAIRVQQAVEALAGIETSPVEAALDDEGR